MIDEPDRIRIGEEIDELLVDVAVVHVEGRHASAIGPEHPLQVLVPVQQIETDVVLARLVIGEAGALAPAAEAVRAEHVGESRRALGNGRVGEPARTRDDALAVGVGGCQCGVRESEVHGATV